MAEPFDTWQARKADIFIAPWKLWLLPDEAVPLTNDLIDTETGIPDGATPLALNRKAPAKVTVTFQNETYTNAGETAPSKVFLNLVSLEISIPWVAVGGDAGAAFRAAFSGGLLRSDGGIGDRDYTAVTPVPIALAGRNRNPLATTQPWLYVASYGAYTEQIPVEIEMDLFSEHGVTLKSMLKPGKREHGIGRIFPL